jgi:hypothetical protein
MFSKLSPIENFKKFTLDLSEKNASSQYVENLNLSHIGNRKCIKFVLQRFFLTKLKVYSFLVEICTLRN